MTALLTITPTIGIAKQDAWISFIISGGLTFIITFIATKLSLLYPTQTLVAYCQTILGRWIGKIIIIPYLVMWYSVSGIILRESSDFIAIAMFDKTPLAVIALLMLSVLVYVIYQGGIEGLARCSEFMGPVIYFTMLFALLLSLTNIHFKSILPVYVDSRWPAILQGSLNPLGFLGESILITMLIPFVSNTKKVMSRVLWGVGFASLLSSLITAMVIMTYGPSLPAKMWYPFLNMIRFVSIGHFVENIDAVIVVAWTLSVFVKLSLYLFITSYGTAQWLNVGNWKNIMWFVACAIFLLSMMYSNIDVSSINYPQKFWAPFVVPVNMVGIPTLLWVVGMIRKRRTNS